MKKFFKLLLINFAKAIMAVTILAIYAIPMNYVATSNFDADKIGLFLFAWLVIWIVLLITVFQCIKNKKE